EKLKPRHRDAFDLLLLTGARPGELIGLTTGAIDRTGEVWRADLAQHKTRHRGKSRTLYFNATAQLILRKYLKPTRRLGCTPNSSASFETGSLPDRCRRTIWAFTSAECRRRSRDIVCLRSG